MTPENQRIAIAEACGWQSEGWEHHQMPYWINPEGKMNLTPPDYLNDLNAMHEAEESLTDYQQEQMFIQLCEMGADNRCTRYVWHATATQRAEAFLRTIGKWKE